MAEDIRWVQRFDHFKKAYAQLQDALALMETRPLSNIEKQGAIHTYEFTYELAWNVLRDYLVWQGTETLSGSRDAIREGFKRELISDGHAWLAMLQDRNRTVHTYNEETANQILEQLRSRYAGLFAEFMTVFQNKSAQLDESFS
ncbi:MAG: nucleotidyltransferase substrate binding protein [Hydrogenovibrio sp.]|uniref:nucleotidyltransferase substrate binding protein n=1 Tax=Hydrogenovibrio sp. TaxID=2065821 RepID=UPI0028709DDE|nr:nucleotidyltransferase substrate binding protein [Hydrogenovibrio sp.]MDR9499937.1 nucleotidyltransferase substrate binding protein [Hydrogenovibrio sp.]